jgi:superfamily II DNA or RNA helicase
VQESHAAVSAAQLVLIRDERWAVLQVEQFGSCRLLKLRGVSSTNQHELRTVLTPFDVIDRITAASALRQRSRRAVLSAVARAVADAAAWDDSWIAAGARLDLHAWQLEPARAAVSGAMRILLADGVGLGKTIQAGLIVGELFARGLARHVLILTPASLREQWAAELSRRFGLETVIFDQPAVAAAATTLPPEVNPWSTAPLIISSIDLVKRAEMRASIDGVFFDALIVDEAHHVSRGSDRGAMIADLASRTPWVVLCTATPHSGDDDAYDYLTRLGATGGDELRVFRRSVLRDRALTRRCLTLPVTPNTAEVALLQATHDYARALARRRPRGAGYLIGGVIARRAASSAAAVTRTLSRRAALLAKDVTPTGQPTFPWEEDEAQSDDVADAALAVPGLANASDEVAWLRRLVSLATAASGTSSKIAAIRRLLRRTTEQAIVFSEYRDVAVEVAAALADLASVATLHGGLTVRERRAAVSAFKSAFNGGSARILVATDAAGEGLNLHARCRLVINIEVPWTPLRLEQRIGRVDRLGQTRRVHAVHLVHRDSYEGTVVARLERRRARAASPRDLALADHCTTAARARRLQQLAGGYSQGDGHAVYAGRAGRRNTAQPGCWLCLAFTVPVVDATGRPIERHVAVVRGSTTVRRLPRRLLRALQRDTNVGAVLDAHIAPLVSERQVIAGRIADRMERRMSAILERLQRRSDAASWQGSLFDRRHELQAQRTGAARAALRAELTRRQDAAQDLRRLHAGEPRLIAAWLDVQ